MENLTSIVLDCQVRANRAKDHFLSKTHISEFEVDYELNFILFISLHMGGQSAAMQHGFMVQLSKEMHWSLIYRKLILEKIKKQPSFDFESLKLATSYPDFAEALYQWALVMIWLGGEIHSDEKSFIENLRDYLFDGDFSQRALSVEQRILEWDGGQQKNLKSILSSLTKGDHITVDEKLSDEEKETASLEEALERLDRLVGLEEVKEEVKKLVHFLEIQKKRKEMGLKSSQLSCHMVFTGNPGTGKTTVARILGDIFSHIGLLKKGHLVEADRSRLVGQYVGHTEKKTSSVVSEAMDGVLFIDEAYSLYKNTENDFGQEAIDTLVKRMEDFRERLVVIVAGYPEEMDDFINANPGLKSRFNNYIEFHDYKPEELLAIFDLIIKGNEYDLTPDGRNTLLRYFEDIAVKKKRDFGNGRLVRNLFETMLRNQAMRLSQNKDLKIEDLVQLNNQDVALSIVEE